MNTPDLPSFWAVIPAAGIGSRMRADKPKQYLQLAGKSILEHTLNCFLDHPCPVSYTHLTLPTTPYV